jgi:hypothetical protein
MMWKSRRSNDQSDKYSLLRRMIRRLEASNSIISGIDVFHHLVHKGDAPAWTIDTDIYFHSGKLPIPEDKKSIMVITGVNNHELGHVLFTPSIEDIKVLFPGAPNVMLSKLQHDAVYQNLFNALEDQRMEMLLCKRFANQRPYLMAGFNYIIMQNEKLFDHAYLLARGRRYLPVKIRRMLKNRFKKPELIKDIRRIIDSFVKLNLFRGQDLYKAHQLITELRALLAENDMIPPEESCTCGTMSLLLQASSRKQPSADEVDDILAEVVEAMAQDGDAQQVSENGPDSAAGGSDDPDAGKGGGTGPDAEDGPSEGDGGSTQGIEARATNEEVKGELTALLAVEANSSEVSAEVAAVEHYIRTALDLDIQPLKESRALRDGMPMIAKRTSKALRFLEDDVDPTWERATTSGKLNIGQLIKHPDDREYAFDRWQEGGESAADQEWVVLLDCSGTMSAYLDMLGQASWIMKRAADLSGAKMTIISWGSHNIKRLIYGPDDRAELNKYPNYPGHGNTQPLSALVDAYKVLQQSKRKQKGLLVMTDGDWHYSPAVEGWTHAHDVIKDLNAHGVMTHLTYFGNRSYPSHECQTHGAIGSIEELPTIMKELIAGRIKRGR